MGNDVLQVQGINSKGFGIIPKLVMQDRRLTAQAKAIYGYFSSYAGNGNTAFPSVSKIRYDLKISKSTYYTHFNLLKECGYIKVEQVKSKSGKYFNNIYTLADSLPCPEFQDTVKNPSPCPNFQYTEIQDTEKRDTEFQDINNNSIKNNNLNINNPVKSSQSEKSDRQDKDTTDDVQQNIEAYFGLIKENISYNDLAVTRPYDMKLVDEFIAIIVDTALTEGKTVRIGGEDKPRALVMSQLMKLTYSDIELVIDQFKSVTDRINKKKRYILTMLYNSKLEGDSHYTNAVISDRWQ